MLRDLESLLVESLACWLWLLSRARLLSRDKCESGYMENRLQSTSLRNTKSRNPLAYSQWRFSGKDGEDFKQRPLPSWRVLPSAFCAIDFPGWSASQSLKPEAT